MHCTKILPEFTAESATIRYGRHYDVTASMTSHGYAGGKISACCLVSYSFYIKLHNCTVMCLSLPCSPHTSPSVMPPLLTSKVKTTPNVNARLWPGWRSPCRPLGVTGWGQCCEFLSVLGHCWLGNRRGDRPTKKTRATIPQEDKIKRHPANPG